MTLPQTFSDLSKRYSLLLAMPDVEAGFSFTRSDMEAIGEALKIAARVMDGGRSNAQSTGTGTETWTMRAKKRSASSSPPNRRLMTTKTYSASDFQNTADAIAGAGVDQSDEPVVLSLSA